MVLPSGGLISWTARDGHAACRRPYLHAENAHYGTFCHSASIVYLNISHYFFSAAAVILHTLHTHAVMVHYTIWIPLFSLFFIIFCLSLLYSITDIPTGNIESCMYWTVLDIMLQKTPKTCCNSHFMLIIAWLISLFRRTACICEAVRPQFIQIYSKTVIMKPGLILPLTFTSPETFGVAQPF